MRSPAGGGGAASTSEPIRRPTNAAMSVLATASARDVRGAGSRASVARRRQAPATTPIVRPDVASAYGRFPTSLAHHAPYAASQPLSQPSASAADGSAWSSAAHARAIPRSGGLGGGPRPFATTAKRRDVA